MREWNSREAETRRARIAREKRSSTRTSRRMRRRDRMAALSAGIKNGSQNAARSCAPWPLRASHASNVSLAIGFPQKSRRERTRNAKFAGEAEMRIACKRPSQMQRRGQGRGAKPPRLAARARGSSRRNTLAGEADRPCRRLREIDKLRAARQEDVLAVVDFHAVDLERGGPAAQDTAALEKLDVRSGRFELKSRCETGEAASDDRYALDSQDRTTTTSFSVLESAARARNGSPGSRSIFLSSSS